MQIVENKYVFFDDGSSLFVKEGYIFTSDDEEPNCMQCMNCCANREVCNHCGSQCGWKNYKRLEIIKRGIK